MNVTAKSMIVIADDLTGANDTGVQFAGQGMQTEVLLDGAALTPSPATDIIVVDTNSRAIPAKEAYLKVQTVAKQAHSMGFLHYYKKLDSTLRGNVGVELKAILDLGLHEFAFVMPALPNNGRTTVGGHVLLHGVPLAATEIAKDPKSPVNETVLPELLRQQTASLVGHIGIAELCQGEAAITKAIQQHLTQGCTIISCDAWLDEHFPLAASAALRVSQRILWSGSAGLAEFLPQLLKLHKPQTKQPTLVVAGSVSSVTRGQIDNLLADGYQLIDVQVADHLPFQQSPSLPSLQTALSYLAAGKSVVLASGY
ncbi:MAG TPA: four-carbon acid sugar kinase family protein, partial [Negativicutes bacterium]